MGGVGRMWRGSGMAAFAVIAACTGAADRDRSDADEGAVAISASALSAADVATVRVTISGTGISAPIVTTLVKVGGQWQGFVGKIPSGTNRTFHGEALDAAGKVVYRGDAFGVTITKNTTAAVAMLLQQASAPAPFANHAPVVDAMVVSTNAPAVGEPVTLTASAHDVDVGDSIRLEWVASAGSFSTTTGSTTTWTAPATEGPQTITVRVYDSKGSMNALTFSASVNAGFGSGSVTASFNTWPTVNGLVASPSRIDVGETTALTLSATDNDGDPLSYAWSATCAGTFSDVAAANPRFTLSALGANGTCGLVVAVSDGRGGVNTGTLGIQTGPGASPNVAPQVDSTFQSAASAGDGEDVVFRIHAFDPEGTAVSYGWTADKGVIAATDATGTEAKWTAPAGFSGQAIISALVTDATGVATTQPFLVTARTGGSPSGDGGTDGATDGGQATTTVLGQATATPSGGTLTFGDVELEVPAGAVAADTSIVVSRLNAPAAPGALAGYFAFEPHGTTFTKPVTVRLPLATGGATSARVLWSRTGDDGYDLLDTRVEGNVAVAETMHFSIATVAPDGEADGGAAAGGGTKCGNGTIDPTDKLGGPYCQSFGCTAWGSVFGGGTVCLAYGCTSQSYFPVYEQCDDGNTLTESCPYGQSSCVVCRADCTYGPGPVTGVCGDGIVNGPEGCDDGNTVTESCAYGQSSCTVCRADCTNGPGAVVGVCGDGTVNGPESCDDGNTVTESCAYGQSSCTVCRADCTTGPGAVVGVCGDGTVNGPETCDDGNTVTESCAYGLTSCTVCTSTCQTGPGAVAFCGDGVTNGAETCDDGNSVTEKCSYGLPSCTVCRADCTTGAGIAEFCGDAVVNGGEQCDDGNAETEACPTGTSCQVCRANCTFGPGTGEYCGNGVVEAGEECDTFPEGSCTTYGFLSGNVTCTASCKTDTAQCTRYASEIVNRSTSSANQARFGASSYDGRAIAWTTSQQGWTDVSSDPAGSGTRVFLYTRASNTPSLLLAPDGGGNPVLPNGAVDSISIDDNGSLVAFSTTATNLVSSDANAATADCFIWHSAGNVFERIPSRTGTQPASACVSPALSRSGRYLALAGSAADFAPGGVGGQYFVYDRSLGTFESIDLGPTGAAPNGSTASPRVAISADGRFVTFVSPASNLVAGDTNGRADVFVRDRTLGTTTRVSVKSDGSQLPSGASDFVVSTNGVKVAFFGIATEVMGTGSPGNQVFVRDITASTTTYASPPPPPNTTWSVALTRLYSVDGRGRPLFGDSTKTFLFNAGMSVSLVPPGPPQTIYIGAYFTKDEQSTVAWTTPYASGAGYVSLTTRGRDGM
jgi:hypothetical protein